MPGTLLPSTNGQAQPPWVRDKLLGEPLTQGYRPTLPLWALYLTDAIPQFFLIRDVELMMIHPVIRNTLDYYKGGVSGAEFVGPNDPADPSGQNYLPISQDQQVAAFVFDHCMRYWDRGVPRLQGGYEYGWIGAENVFEEARGFLVWEDMIDFAPRDTFLLTSGQKAVGVRVKNIQSKEGVERTGAERPAAQADLWLAEGAIPAKGLWYAHNPRYSQWYGTSQLLGAWRPWRRLAWRDGAETNIDGGFYRGFYSGPLVHYPDEDYQVTGNIPGTALDSQGNPRRYARDIGRQIGEQFKSGASVGIPSTKYPQELGGGDKWGIEYLDTKLNMDMGVNYIKHLWDQIRFGIGVPPELLESSETGSGYSGRRIPLEGFVQQQQKIADALLTLFIRQVLRPLVLWNFGDVPWFVQVKPLLLSKMMQTTQQGGAPPGNRPAIPGQVPPPSPTPGGTMEQPGAEGLVWKPIEGPSGQPGWESPGGLRRYGQLPPGQGFSVEDDEIRQLTAAILEAA